MRGMPLLIGRRFNAERERITVGSPGAELLPATARLSFRDPLKRRAARLHPTLRPDLKHQDRVIDAFDPGRLSLVASYLPPRLRLRWGSVAEVVPDTRWHFATLDQRRNAR